MSQKSLPRSPKAPTSKSPSCTDAPGEEGQQPQDGVNPEELQQAVEEELVHTEQPMTGSRAAVQQSRAVPSAQYGSPRSRGSYHGSSRQQSRIPSPRATSTCEEEPPRLPSPPTSPPAYGSRGPSPTASPVCPPSPGYASRGPSPGPATPGYGSRGPSPAYASRGQSPARGPSHVQSAARSVPPSAPASAGVVRSGSVPPQGYPSRGSPSGVCSKGPSPRASSRGPVYAEDDYAARPDEYPPTAQPSTRTASSRPAYSAGSRPAMATSRASGVTFSNKPSAMLYTSDETSQPYMSYRSPKNQSVTGAASVPGVGTSCGGLGPSNVDMATSAMGYYGVDEATSGMGFDACRVDAGVSAMSYNMPRGGVDAGVSAMSYNMPRGGVDTGVSAMSYNMPRGGVDTGVSAMSYNMPRGGVDTGVSAMSYNMPKGGCVPGCIRFHEETQDVATSTRGMSKESGAHSHGSYGYQKPSQMTASRTPPMSEHVDQSFHSHGRPPSTGTRFSTPSGERLPSPPPPPPGYEGAYMKPMTAGGRGHAHMHGPEHEHHHPEGMEDFPPGVRDERVMAALGHLSQLKKTPSYLRCGLDQGLDFLKVCCPKTEPAGKPGRPKFPEIPCLREDEIDEMIRCETSDVESAWFLSSEEKKTYKKPCPKQQKAQMSVKALVQAHANQVCQVKEYTPLEHPDPEDISPEVAAAMMFSQERGIKMEECPNATIASLFPDEPKAPFPERIPQKSNISIVDRSSRDQDEMIEKSASISSEGVSDSAYTRKMKEKGEDMGPQRSFDVDFAIGQSKREYVLVTQKPQRVSKAQYRGGNSSPWFPGYLSAFPDDVGLKVVASPSGVFQKAWIHSNPGNIPTGDVIVLD